MCELFPLAGKAQIREGGKKIIGNIGEEHLLFITT